MKSVQIYIGVAIALLIMGIGATVYVWYTIQSFDREKETISTTNKVLTSTNSISEATGTTSEEVRGETEKKEEDIVIEVESLTDTQRSALRAFGYEGSEIVITEEVITCAKNAIGESRLNEITNGSAPNPLEAVKLARCMQ